MNTKVNQNQPSIQRAFVSRFAMHLFFTILILFIMTYVGSRMFTHMDLNLYGYMVGTLVFLIGLFYRFLSWSERPPAKLMIKKGKKLIFRKKTVKTTTTDIGMQRFIWNRGIYRWFQHMLMGWGVIISCFVTFPLVFGWMYFTMDDNGFYTVVFMGLNLMKISADGFLAFLFYNSLNITAIMVITGASMAIYRRLKNLQARAEQTVIFDFMPLYMLLFISITGLLLTVSNVFFHGFIQPELSLVHQFSVIVTLIYLPFGKLAHIPMRPLGIYVKNYREHYANQSMKKCKVCSNEFVSTEQSNDVIHVLDQNAIQFKKEEGFHLAELCLPCRRNYRISKFSGVKTHLTKAKEANQDARG
ncbi:hypothetical protein [Chengkuizengella sediminis]|uniref:hypothetical protein n=1 Tax=Chengkuizengella sediminis TaxID=1885917 RepID=UPI001478E2DD|nr:hypothetical protein [Chengkuizengella sediminis]